MKFIYITCASRAEALQIGRKLVENKLAACANIIDGMTSCYWWEGNVEEAHEAVLIAKTTAGKVDQLIAEVKNLHSYELPCVISLDIESGNPDYLAWISGSVS
ncbi:MAG: divalent-cation tolerance protein CutA [Bacteroidia bacterium]